MKNLFIAVLLSVSLAGVVSPALAEDESGKQSTQVMHETVELGELLEIVSRKSGKEFLVDRRVSAEVVTGTVKASDIDYAVLLSVLRNNGMAAAPSNDAIRIIPVSLIRQYELPTLRDNDDTIPDDEWVTRVLRLENTAAPRVVPLLRPMIPKEGHLIGEAEANLLIVVAPYGVTKRVVGIAGEIDANADKPQASSQ